MISKPVTESGLTSSTTSLPIVALSIRQPWAWLIVQGHKDIENRHWKTKHRGPVLIHAAKTFGEDERFDQELIEEEMRRFFPDAVLPMMFDLGGIVGVADIVDCVTDSPSRWFNGPVGFVLANARPLPFMPCKGMPGFFKMEYVNPNGEGDANADG